MLEMFHIQGTQCGNQIDLSTGRSCAPSTTIDVTGKYTGDSELQLKRINVYYNEASGGRFFPHAVLLDVEPGTMDNLRSGAYSQIFRPDNFEFAQI